MKKIQKYALITGFAGLLVGSVVLAQDTGVNRGSQYQQEIQQIREQALTQIKQLRDNMLLKIGQIKDQRKQQAATKIANQLSHTNEVWTDHMTNVLDRLDAILQKIKSRADKAQANGQDITAITTAINNAESKITAARSAVADQAKKTYVVDTSSITGATSTTSGQNSLVSKLRTQFMSLRDQLFKDLTSLRDGAMKDARQSVQDAFQALSQVPNVDKEPATNQNNQP